VKILPKLLGAAALAVCATSAAMAAENAPGAATGTEGANADEVVVTAERNTAAIEAPTKASILQTQPESLITHKFIEQATPESGDYTTAVLIAPSIAGVSSNGGGVGDVNTSTLRGFQDGQFNMTYDGIAFGDANDTTHHPAAFFPGSTIGTAVVDRGPGAAGDMGQANFGGAIHLFSPSVSDAQGISQKFTYGSFNTKSAVTTIQTGAISQLDGAKLLLNFDERSSDGEQSYMNGVAYNQTAKLVLPISDKLQVTAFTSWNYTRYNQTDNGAGLGAGVTPQQQALYGINFALDNDPTDEHYWGYNNVHKHTDFNYLDVRWEPSSSLSVEDQGYYYFYNNQTVSSQCAADPVVHGGDPTGCSAPSDSSLNPNDVAGYHKQNRYHTYGDILRINQDFGFGTLRAGGLVEKSSAVRFISNWDLTTGQPDYGLGYSSAPGTNYSYYEPSGWTQYQIFADFEWRPLDNLTITPGIKYMHYKRTIDATIESDGDAVVGSRTYEKPTYFFTANYRIMPNWSVYAQVATAFLIPPVKTLTPPGGATSPTAPQQTVTYQVGTVYTAGRITFDADYYFIHAGNVLINDSKDPKCFCYLNAGAGRYFGVEGQGAYNFGYGFTAFANGSINIAKDTNDGVPGDPETYFSNAPKWTAAFGLIYDYQKWQATLSDKFVGDQLASDGATWLGSYSTIDASVSYDFGKFKLKVAAFNLANERHPLDFDGTFWVYQVGRQVQGTIQAKF
jgi:iron complex outermembrane receptor protein